MGHLSALPWPVCHTSVLNSAQWKAQAQAEVKAKQAKAEAEAKAEAWLAAEAKAEAEKASAVDPCAAFAAQEQVTGT
jgi:hypothetical protein